MILRNQNDFFDKNDGSQFTTFWAPLIDNAGNGVGTIGLQIDQKEYFGLLP